MSTLDDFSDDGDESNTNNDFDRSEKPLVRRVFGVKDPEDKTTLFGMLAKDKRRGGWVYTSPRKREDNFFRKIGGYPISTSILERLAEPPNGSNVDPVHTVFIIQRESTDDFPAMTVFEYALDDYLEAAVINFPPFGEQRCPRLEDARAVWPAWGDAMFETGEL